MAQPRMRRRHSTWFGVLGIHVALLVGCEGTGLVIESEGTGGEGGAGGETGGTGATNGSGGKATGGGTGASAGYGGKATGGDSGEGTGASAGYGGKATGGDSGEGTGASAGYGGKATGGDYGGGTGASGGYAGGSYGGAGGGYVEPEDCDLMLTAPSVVPPHTDLTDCRGFDIGADPAVQIEFIRPILMPKTTHHMVLYQAPSGPLPAGECPADLGTPIHVWQPGMNPLILPPDVGISTGSGRFILKLHAVNATSTPLAQSAGFCVGVDQGRPHSASVVNLGAMDVTIPPHTAGSQDSCTPPLTDTARILAVAMDLSGVADRGTVTVNRAGGGSEVIVDEPGLPELGPFTQVPAVTLEAGDVVRSTCSYRNHTNSTFTGNGCRLWALAYPGGNLPAADQACGD